MFMFLLYALNALGAFMRTKFLCSSALRVASGHRVKLVGCKSAVKAHILCLLAGVVHHDSTQYTALIMVAHIKG